MRKKKIYIIHKNSRAAAYGIGTYKTQLIECLKQTSIEFGVIELCASVNEVIVEQNNGYELISIPLIIYKYKKYYSRNVAYILREVIFEDAEYDLIFHINLMGDETLVNYLKKLFRCKIILTVHYTNWSLELLGNTQKLNEIFVKKIHELNDNEKQIRQNFEEEIKMAQKSDCVIYIAQHSANTLSKYIKTKNAMIINNGLKDEYKELSSQERLSLKAKYFIPPQTKVIVFAGRIDKVKGVNFLIKSFKKVLNTFPDTMLVIAGDGDFTPLFKEAIYIWSKIIFTGKIEKEKLYELYRIADIGVLCSLHEEFGYVAVEMMMHRLPVIVSHTGGFIEIVESGVSGIKIPIVTKKGERSINTTLLTSKICLLLEDNNLAVNLSEGARKRFLEKYELSIFAENMISAYKDQ